MKIRILVLYVFIFGIKSFSQSEAEFKDSFLEAYSYFHFEEYSEALPIFLKLSRENPYNDNLNYLIGRCYLHNDYRVKLSITYLEKAIKNINSKYKPESFKETQAPVDAVFYLGEAYHKNNFFDKAIEQYEKFLVLMDENIYDAGLVKMRIESCEYAKIKIKSPVNIDFKNEGEIVNSRFEEYAPVISGDGKTLAFTRKLQFYEAIFVSYLKDGKWTEPLNIIPDLGVDGNIVTTSLNYNGTALYIYNRDEYDGNIYVSYKKQNTWGKLKKLNEHINTKYWEVNASESPDGSMLYFSSNRPGGVGRLDIYMSFRRPDGDWGPAVNIGPEVNTIYDEDAPFITMDGNMLVFSSYGHLTIGDYDYFYSIKKGNFWTEPENFGYPLNTAGEEILLSPASDGKHAYVSLYRDDTYGLKDIYSLELNVLIPENIIESVSKLTHPAAEPDKTIHRDTFSIAIAKTDEKQNIIPASADKISSDSIAVSGQREETITDNRKNISLKPKLYIQNKEFNVTASDVINIPVEAEKNTVLKVSVKNNGVIVSENTYRVTDNKFIYKFTPYEGVNDITFELTGENGYISTENIQVYYTPVPSEEDVLTVSSSQGTGMVDLNTIIENLKRSAKNKYLISVLDTIQDNNPGSLDYILEYLFSRAGDSTYTITELIETILKTVGLNNININDFYAELLKSSGKAIKEFISGLQVNEQGLTPVSLLEYLFKSENTENYSLTDLYNTIGQIVLSNYRQDKSAGLRSILGGGNKSKGTSVLILILTGILVIIIFVYKKRRKKNGQKE